MLALGHWPGQGTDAGTSQVFRTNAFECVLYVAPTSKGKSCGRRRVELIKQLFFNEASAELIFEGM